MPSAPGSQLLRRRQRQKRGVLRARDLWVVSLRDVVQARAHDEMERPHRPTFSKIMVGLRRRLRGPRMLLRLSEISFVVLLSQVPTAWSLVQKVQRLLQNLCQLQAGRVPGAGQRCRHHIALGLF